MLKFIISEFFKQTPSLIHEFQNTSNKKLYINQEYGL